MNPKPILPVTALSPRALGGQRRWTLTRSGEGVCVFRVTSAMEPPQRLARGCFGLAMVMAAALAVAQGAEMMVFGLVMAALGMATILLKRDDPLRERWELRAGYAVQVCPRLEDEEERYTHRPVTAVELRVLPLGKGEEVVLGLVVPPSGFVRLHPATPFTHDLHAAGAVVAEALQVPFNVTPEAALR
jgi:hypothetical protein